MAKLYTKATWTDEELAAAARYDILADDDTPINEDVQIEQVTEVAVAGSPVSAARMNNIEDGLDAVDAKVAGYQSVGADIASASTTDIGAATGEFVTITGSVTITALGTVAAGKRVVCVFSGAPLLTHNATSLILPAAVNYQVVAGDVLIFKSLGSGNWKCMGFLGNGSIMARETDYKITPSVTSNNLTVALTHADGTVPSATRPLWVKIGFTWYPITAALSATKNAATNWFAAGSAELATKEIDYFVYLGYNATNGVTIGFSRIPFGGQYSDFSATTTNEKYCAISTITNAASTDYYENIGRFAASLTGTAGFAWSVPTFTPVNLIQRPIYNTRWLTWAPQFSASGSMTFATAGVTITEATYMINQITIIVNLLCSGTTGASAATVIYFTTPLIPSNYAYGATVISDGGVGINGQNQGGTSQPACGIQRYDGGNWGIGASRVIRTSIVQPL